MTQKKKGLLRKGDYTIRWQLMGNGMETDYSQTMAGQIKIKTTS